MTTYPCGAESAIETGPSRSLRLLFLSRMLPTIGAGGMEDHAAWLASAMARRGHSVRLLTTTPLNALTVRLDGVDVITVPGDPHRWSSEFMSAVARGARDMQPDVIISESTAAIGLARTWPTVFHLHGNHINELRAPLATLGSRFGPPLRHVMRRVGFVMADYLRWRPWRMRMGVVICLSSRELRAVRVLYAVPRQRLIQIGNAVDLSLWPVGGWPRPPTILFAGRLEPGKGADQAIRALAEPELRQSGARLIVAGSGSLEPRLRHLVHDLALNEEVDFVGYCRQPELSKLLRTARVFCLPSTRQESFSLSCLQALASGTPVVSTRAGNAWATIERLDPVMQRIARREVVVESSGGHKGLAQVLSRFVADTGGMYRERLAREVAVANAQDEILQQMEDVYRRTAMNTHWL